MTIYYRYLYCNYYDLCIAFAAALCTTTTFYFFYFLQLLTTTSTDNIHNNMNNSMKLDIVLLNVPTTDFPHWQTAVSWYLDSLVNGRNPGSLWSLWRSLCVVWLEAAEQRCSACQTLHLRHTWQRQRDSQEREGKDPAARRQESSQSLVMWGGAAHQGGGAPGRRRAGGGATPRTTAWRQRRKRRCPPGCVVPEEAVAEAGTEDGCWRGLPSLQQDSQRKTDCTYPALY